MVKVIIKHDPSVLKTDILIDGSEILPTSQFYRLIQGKKIEDWIDVFIRLLGVRWGDITFKIDAEDSDAKFDCIAYLLKRSREQDAMTNVSFAVKGKQVFPINVVATMSSGKSTLINTLLGKKLMPAQNEACTAKITEIIDNDEDVYDAVVHNAEGDVVSEISELSYNQMVDLNRQESVHRISVTGKIPFLKAEERSLMIVDTPGPNNSQDQRHWQIAYDEIDRNINSLIIYILNATQLGTNDDAKLLSYVTKKLKATGQSLNERIVFILNKMDQIDPEEEDIESIIQNVKAYLASHGIENPQLFPCSAYVALNIRTGLKGIDIDSMTRDEVRNLPRSVRETLRMIDMFVEYPSMHLEQYVILSPKLRRQIDNKLKKAKRKGNLKEQALIHSGIYGLEMFLKECVSQSTALPYLWETN